ncbi:MAG: 4Fe-4S dicluster domain-containing protein [Peptococcaceae bacterium]
MAAVIDQERCIGCGRCVEYCPGDIIYLDDLKNVAVVKYPDECWHCACCRIECPEQCVRIVFPLGIIP